MTVLRCIGTRYPDLDDSKEWMEQSGTLYRDRSKGITDLRIFFYLRERAAIELPFHVCKITSFTGGI